MIMNWNENFVKLFYSQTPSFFFIFSVKLYRMKVETEEIQLFYSSMIRKLTGSVFWCVLADDPPIQRGFWHILFAKLQNPFSKTCGIYILLREEQKTSLYSLFHEIRITFFRGDSRFTAGFDRRRVRSQLECARLSAHSFLL